MPAIITTCTKVQLPIACTVPARSLGRLHYSTRMCVCVYTVRTVEIAIVSVYVCTQHWQTRCLLRAATIDAFCLVVCAYSSIFPLLRCLQRRYFDAVKRRRRSGGRPDWKYFVCLSNSVSLFFDIFAQFSIFFICRGSGVVCWLRQCSKRAHELSPIGRHNAKYIYR